ncbi:MAG: YeeE/YedE family protein [Chitinophagaceae bacterium]|nr:YeeE/YedE family protein [Chitinophagaceae bacterium]
MSFSEWLHEPWPWYVAGPLIGLIVPLLLIIGNKPFGISSSLRHICAACLPSGIPYFKYNWKHESWNLFFVAGIIIGGAITALWFNNPKPILLNPILVGQFQQQGITNFRGLLPPQLFNWNNLFSAQGFLLVVVGGFLVGFGTRYAGGCTSGHSIMGLSNLQWPSLVATACFMAGGFVTANLIIPIILKW